MVRRVLTILGGGFVLAFAIFMAWYYAYAIHPSANQLRLFNPAIQTTLFIGSLHDKGSANFYTVYAHGIGPTLNDGRMFISDGTGIATRMINAKEVANLIRSYDWDGKKPIHLVVCRVGDKKIGLAQNLANELGVPVYATDRYYYIRRSGIVGIYDRKDMATEGRDPSKPGKLFKFEPQIAKS